VQAGGNALAAFAHARPIATHRQNPPTMKKMSFIPAWTLAAPIAGWLILAGSLLGTGGWYALLMTFGLFASVLVAVHHAEVVAHRVGEPFGTLVLALAVTVIEVALIVSMMLAGGPDKATLPRDTIFAAIMIICNGVVGICLLLGAMRHHEQIFRLEGANSAMATLVVMATLSLVLPAFTTSGPGATYTVPQLGFVAVASLGLWAVFVFVQTVRHRDYFLPAVDPANEAVHAAPPSVGQAWASFGWLLVSLVSVVGLAKVLSPSIEAGVTAAGAPKAVIGIAIAMLVLLPETWAAVRAARANRLQTSLNLALGSALASIGLTIPAVAIVALATGWTLTLGIDPKSTVLLLLSLMVATLSLGTGRTTVLQGVVHLVIFAVYLFTTIVP
jgi:Ca2+:H+ antiporter